MPSWTPTPPPPHPVYTPGEYLADALAHMLGLVAGGLGGGWLIVSRWNTPGAGVLPALSVYALAMAAMFTCSAAYNLCHGRPLKERLRRLDHACIYAAIAGTYTPLLIRLPGSAHAPLALLVVWLVAMAGIGLKLAAPRRFERLGLALYIGLGWIGLPMIPALSGHLRPGTGWWIGLGAVIYTLGVGFYLARHMRYHNALWHLMVLVAAGVQYVGISHEFP